MASSQEEIDQLIKCPKIIIDPPQKNLALKEGHLRNGAKLKGRDNDALFKMFVRILEDFQENFSIGLVYLPNDGSSELHLIRCNGPHGPFEGIENRHRVPHIHLATSANIEGALRGNRGAKPTDKYSNYREALIYFVRMCNIKNAHLHFPEIEQPDLFPE